jgi:hypothetical protein
VPAHPWRSRLLTLACLVIGTALAALVGVWATASSRSAQLRGHFEAEADASQRRAYLRSTPGPGWTLESGSAAELYQEAWDACGEWPEEAEASLRQVRRALAGSQGLAGSSLRPPGARVVPPSCAELGVSADNEDLVLAQVDEELCAVLVACAPALQRVAQGTTRTDTDSPVGIWSEFVLEDGDTPRSLAPAMQLGQLLLLQAHAAGTAGDRTAQLDGIFTVMRLGHDMAQGSAVVGAMVGIALQDRASADLLWLLRGEELALGQVQHARGQLEHVLAHPLSAEQALRDELMVSTAMWARPAEPPVTALEALGASWSFTDRVVIGLASADLLQMWQSLIEIQALPYPERARQYPRIHQKASAGSIAALQPDYGQFDARITASRTRLLLLAITAADAEFRLSRSRDPENLAELGRLAPPLPDEDPLTGGEFVLEDRGGHRFLSSSALRARSRASLGLEEIAGGIHPETYLEIRLVEHSSETNAVPD